MHIFGDRVATPFQSLIENAFDIIMILDRDGNIEYISPSVRAVLGYEPEAIQGRNGIEFVHPDDEEMAKKSFRAVVESGGRSQFDEVRVRHDNGTWRVCEAVAHNLVDHPTVHGVVLNYRDITDRKRTEQALRRSEERYQKAFASSPDSITLTRLRDGIVLEASEGFERIMGYRRDELVGRSPHDLGLYKNPEDRKRLLAILERDGRLRDFETQYVVKSGDVRTCSVSAEVINLEGERCMVAVTRDVTETKRAQAQLQRTSDELRREHKALQEKNIALKQILDHIEEDRTSFRQELVAHVENLLRPLIDLLRKSGGRVDATEIDRFEKALSQLTRDDLDTYQANLAKLTSRELDICELVKEGYTSKEVAERLGLSAQTVLKHRQAIRRKLQLNNKDINLATYLRSR